MLYALGDPVSFVLLLAWFVVCVVLAGWLSALTCARAGLREPGRGRPDPRHHVDPFSAVAAAVAGTGWSRPAEVPDHRRGAGVALALLAGPLVLLAAGLLAVAAFVAVHGPVPVTAQLLQRGQG